MTDNDLADCLDEQTAPLVDKSFPELDKLAIIYHYCDINALQGIICNKNLWATHIKFLNDEQEYAHGEAKFANAHNSLANDSDASYLLRVHKEINLQRGNSELECIYPFASCFSKGNDKLSQWRGYAANGHGYAVGFDAHALKNAVKNKLTVIGASVLYDDEAQSQFTREYVKRNINYFDKAISVNDADKHIKTIASKLIHDEHLYSGFLKSRHFFEEDEYRLLVFPLEDEMPSNVRMRTRNGLFVPYIELKPAEGKKLPIREIRIGPCLDFERASFGVSMILEQNGYTISDGVDILQSDIPYIS